MEAYILQPNAIPLTLYRVQNIHHPKPLSTARLSSIYALNPSPSAPLTRRELLAEIDNHVRITHPSRHGPLKSQWPSPFLSVFAAREDAERMLKAVEVPGEDDWCLHEVSGVQLAGNGGKVLRLRDIRVQSGFETEFLIWGVIPHDAVVMSWDAGVSKGGGLGDWKNMVSPPVAEVCTAETDADVIQKEGEEQLPDGFYKVKEVCAVQTDGVVIQKGGEEQLPDGFYKVKAEEEAIQMEGEKQLPDGFYKVKEVCAVQTDAEVIQKEEEETLPDGFFKVKEVLAHWPAKATRKTATFYKVCWEGEYNDEWLEKKNLTEFCIRGYWGGKQQKPKKRRRSARFGRC